MSEPQAQSITIVFADGQRAIYTGMYQIDPRQAEQTIMSIKFSGPIALPRNAEWTEVKE